ncbi:hypothetical protein IGI04_002125 [Brassica rapa subsp. trilocularis]|uniref:Uncharacterized protein n=1 Tax=Brassica rapa subsp. trilocularis TaxID=1813537 RepID=A0ABQ7NUN3_BRACM|nr:hypothetical protein IGI04_002125 [Brassica rapa subsp. trilocularis]
MKVFQIWKTSRMTYLLVSLLTCLPFIIDLSVLVFNQMVLIFHLDIFFRSRTNFGRFMGSLLGSLLKYNTLEYFLEVLFRRLPRRLPISLLKCIKSFKLVVHGGWCIDDNVNIVNT